MYEFQFAFAFTKKETKILDELDKQVESGATAAVFGIGAVGLSVIEGLVKAGASKIIAVDVLDKKL